MLLIVTLLCTVYVIPFKNGEPLLSFGSNAKIEAEEEQELYDNDVEQKYTSDEAWRKDLEATPPPSNATASESADYYESLITANVHDNPKESVKLYESLKQKGINPTIASSIQVADAYIAIGDKEGAGKAYDDAEATVRKTYVPASDITLEDELVHIDDLRKESGL